MDDSELVLRLHSGDKNAYKSIFTNYYSPLCEYASHYIREEEAEELVEDLMLFLWEYREHIIIEISLKAYLFTAVKHRCLNAIRLNRYHEQVHTVLYEKLKNIFDEPDYYLQNDLSDDIEKAVEELPDTYRETFKMSRFGDLTNKEISKVLGVSIKTVEYRISQSLKWLRVRLKDYLTILIM